MASTNFHFYGLTELQGLDTFVLNLHVMSSVYYDDMQIFSHTHLK